MSPDPGGRKLFFGKSYVTGLKVSVREGKGGSKEEKPHGLRLGVTNRVFYYQGVLGGQSPDLGVG